MPTSADLTSRQRRAVLASMCFSLVLVIGALGLLYVALPSIATDLRATQSEQQWIVDAYVVLLAGLLLPAGAIGDRYGRRGTLLAGTVVFVVACALSALADSAGTLIVWRALAGIGAALVMPATLSTITSVYPPEERARAVAIWVAFAGGGGVLGMVTAGALLKSFWWGSAFVVFAAAGVLALIATLVTVPRTSNPDEANIDPAGSLLSFVTISALVFGIIEGPVHGWTGGQTLGGLGVAAVAGAAFLWWERRSPAPLLDPRFFRNPAFAAGTVSLTLLFLVMFGFYLIIFQYMQLVLGYDGLEAALALMPNMLTMLPLSLVAVLVAERHGMRVVMASGLVLTAAGLVAFSALGTGSTYWALLPILVVLGVGIALAMTPGTNAIVAALPPEKQGVASAVNDAAREVGAALGIAILGSAFNAAYRSDIADVVAGLPAQAAAVVKGSPAGALVMAPQLGPAGPGVVAAARDAFITGMQVALLVGAALAVLGVVYVCVFCPGRERTAPGGAPAPPATAGAP